MGFIYRTYLVADRRTKTFAILRPMKRSQVGIPRNAATPGVLSELMMARTPATFLSAISKVGPLFLFSDDLSTAPHTGPQMESIATSDFDATNSPRLLEPSAVQSLIDNDTFLEGADRALIHQLAFDPFYRLGETIAQLSVRRKPFAETARAIAKHSPFSADTDFGDYLNDGECVFQYEPLHSWLLLRNLLSVALRLCGISRRKNALGTHLIEERFPTGGILENAGFTRMDNLCSGVDSSPNAEDAYAIPIAFNTLEREERANTRDLALRLDLINPLMERIAVFHKERWLNLNSAREIILPKSGSPAGSHHFFLPVLSARAKIPEAHKVAEDLSDSETLLLVLCGSDQNCIANDFLNTLDSLFGRRTLDLVADGSVVPEHRDAASALWATVIDHPDYYPLTCRHCGRTVLSARESGREFCSDVCRATYSKVHNRTPMSKS